MVQCRARSCTQWFFSVPTQLILWFCLGLDNPNVNVYDSPSGIESRNKTLFVWRIVTWKGARAKQFSHWIHFGCATAFEFQNSNLDSPVSIKASHLLHHSLLVATCNGKLTHRACLCYVATYLISCQQQTQGFLQGQKCNCCSNHMFSITQGEKIRSVWSWRVVKL